MNRITSLAVVIICISACSPRSSEVSERGRMLCLQESRQSGTPEQAGRRFTECLESIENRLAKEDESKNKASPTAFADNAEQPASATERYKHCFIYSEQIRQAHGNQFGLQGPAISLTNKYGRDDPRAKEAMARQQEAYRRLEQLIPERMRNGLPLIPDSVDIFSRCDRADFFIP